MYFMSEQNCRANDCHFLVFTPLSSSMHLFIYLLFFMNEKWVLLHHPASFK